MADIKQLNVNGTVYDIKAEVARRIIPAHAEVGQTIVVSEVDENGNPSGWEAVNFPDGGSSGGNSGGDNWEVIVDYTVPEGETAGPVEFTVDKDGNAFDLKKAAIFLTVIPPSAEFSDNRAIKCCFDKNSQKNLWGLVAEIGFTVPGTNSNKGGCG